MGGAVKAERADSQPLFGKLGGRVEFAVRHITDDFVQGGEVVAHVAEHVLLHRLQQPDELAGVLSLAGVRCRRQEHECRK